MTKEEREITIQALAQCDLVEFARIVSLAIMRRSDARTESGCDRTKLLLGQAVQTRDDDGSWSPWSISAVASADTSYYKSDWEFGQGEPFWQLGECCNCHTELCSHAKASICPVCGHKNVLT